MTDAGPAWYVYCILAAGQPPRLDGVAGVDSTFGIGLLTEGNLTAVVSRVRPEEFGAEALKVNFEDLDWLARVARTHNRLLGHILNDQAVVPLRLCTIFADESAVRDVLKRERHGFIEALARLRDRAEWSVKALADTRSLVPAVTEHRLARAGAGAPGTGRAFFERKKVERGARDEARALVEQAVEEIHQRLTRQAAAGIRLPPQSQQLSGHPGEMALNGAYLVDRPRADEFAARVNELAARHREIGLTLHVSGPFAAYNFVTIPEQRA